MKKFWKDFTAFAMQGNVINLAVGVIIGGAFNTIVTSLVNDIIMPLIGLLTGGVNVAGLFVSLDGNSYPSIAAAQAAGAGTLNYGAFLQNIINFLIIALSIFVAVRLITKLSKRLSLTKEEEAAPKPLCPYCNMEIPAGATKCPYCTADLPAPAAAVKAEPAQA